MSPVKIPKQQFYNFCMKFSICTYHRRINFLNFWLREGRKFQFLLVFLTIDKKQSLKKPQDSESLKKYSQDKL